MKQMKRQLLLLISLIALATSCKTLEEKCAERFPKEVTYEVRERRISDTLMIPVHTMEYIDTTNCPPSDTPTVVIETKYIEVPGKTIEYEVQCMDTVTIYPDQEKINYLSEQLRIAKAEAEAARNGCKDRSWIILGLGVLAVLLLYFTMKRS
jgi:hypothetical protein